MIANFITSRKRSFMSIFLSKRFVSTSLRSFYHLCTTITRDFIKIQINLLNLRRERFHCHKHFAENAFSFLRGEHFVKDLKLSGMRLVCSGLDQCFFNRKFVDEG